MTWRQHVYQLSQRANGPLPPVPRTRQRHPPPVRGPAGLLRRGAPRRRGGPPLRLHPGQLPRPRPPVPPGSPTAPSSSPRPRDPSAAPKADPLRDRIIALRKQNLSIYDISRNLARRGAPAQPGRRRPDPQGRRVRPPAPPRRRRAPAGTAAHHGRRRRRPATRPEPRGRLRTKFGGLFLFLPDLGLDPLRPHRSARRGCPDREMIPAGLRPPLPAGPEALRHRPPPPRHERRAGRGAGPLRRPERHPQAVLPDRVQLPDRPGLLPEADAPLVRRRERARPATRPVLRPGFPHHPLSTATTPWSRSTTSPSGAGARRASWPSWPRTPTPASSATPTPSCARTSRTTRSSASSGSGSERTGHYPEELIFDSKLTTYAKLDELNRLGIDFITLRRRSAKVLDEIRPDAPVRLAADRVGGGLADVQAPADPRSPDHPDGLRRPPAAVDRHRPGARGADRSSTNQLTRPAAKLIGRYAQRMIIENTIEDGIDFFHMDALSSAVAMKVNCDLQLTLMASSLYRLLAGRIGRGYEQAKSRHLFRDFVDATAAVTITESEIQVRYPRLQFTYFAINPTVSTDFSAQAWPCLGGPLPHLLRGYCRDPRTAPPVGCHHEIPFNARPMRQRSPSRLLARRHGRPDGPRSSREPSSGPAAARSPPRAPATTARGSARAAAPSVPPGRRSARVPRRRRTGRCTRCASAGSGWSRSRRTSDPAAGTYAPGSRRRRCPEASPGPRPVPQAGHRGR